MKFHQRYILLQFVVGLLSLTDRFIGRYCWQYVSVGLVSLLSVDVLVPPLVVSFFVFLAGKKVAFATSPPPPFVDTVITYVPTSCSDTTHVFHSEYQLLP